MTEWLSNDYYRFIFENSFDAIMLTTPDGGIHRANPSACRMFLMTEDELCRAGRAGVVDQCDPRLHADLATRERFGMSRGEFTFVRKDGSRFPGEYSSTIFTDSRGQKWTALIVRDQTELRASMEELKKAQEKAVRLASFDDLTHVLNRRVFVERLREEVERGRRESAATGLILMDVDYFKSINDTYGHLAGDHVLRRFALTVKKHLRPYDILGRFGGDEFIVCLPSTTLEASALIAERLRGSISAMKIQYQRQPIAVTASLGVTACSATAECKGVDHLILRADKALYMAKKKKNCVIIV